MARSRLKTIAKEILTPKTPIEKRIQWIKALTEEERQLLRQACIKGKIESSEVWKNSRYGVCTYCQMYRETRIIGAYTQAAGKRAELLNEQTEHCIKYGYERVYHWSDWSVARKEERLGPEKDWHRI